MTRDKAARIPIPLAARPVAPIDPRANRDACVEMLSILYHAEKAALEAFHHLDDPTVVENCELFLQARVMLIADENAHLRDMEQIVRLIGGSEVGPAPPGFAELWDLEQARQKLSFPLPGRVAALFTLIAESLGYAYLYHLVNATTDARVASLLRANLDDERRHLQLSMQVLQEALAEASALVGFELVFHSCAFLLLSRRAAKTMLKALAAVGFDPYVMAASSLHFTWLLLKMVVEERFGESGALRRLEPLSRVAFSPAIMRLFEAAAYLPEPPFIWPVFRRVARVGHRLSAGLLKRRAIG